MQFQDLVVHANRVFITDKVANFYAGGSGKTQTALQYAFRNRFKYKSGIIFFNASSNTTLIADFHRIYDLLGLGSASNKIDFLKKWFSKPTN